MWAARVSGDAVNTYQPGTLILARMLQSRDDAVVANEHLSASDFQSSDARQLFGIFVECTEHGSGRDDALHTVILERAPDLLPSFQKLAAVHAPTDTTVRQLADAARRPEIPFGLSPEELLDAVCPNETVLSLTRNTAAQKQGRALKKPVRRLPARELLRRLRARGEKVAFTDPLYIAAGYEAHAHEWLEHARYWSHQLGSGAEQCAETSLRACDDLLGRALDVLAAAEATDAA